MTSLTGTSNRWWLRMATQLYIRTFCSLLQLAEAVLGDFEDDGGVAVGDLADFVFGGGPQHLSNFRRREFVILLEPLGHAGGGGAERVVERAGEPDGNEVRRRFDARAGHALGWD